MNKVHIDKIRLLDGKFNSIQIGDLSDVKIKNKEIIGFDSDIRHSNRMNIENKLMKIIFDIQIFALTNESKSDKKLSAQFKMSFNFYIENLDELVIPAKSVKSKSVIFNIDAELGKTSVSVAYSTARGMLINQNRGLWVENAILPLIKPDDLLKTHK